LDRFLTQFSPLVWPLVTLAIAMVFRRDLGQALGRIGKVKYRDLELTFRDDLRQAEQLDRSIPPPAAKAAVVLEVAPDEARPLGGRLIVSPSTSDGSPERHDSPENPDLSRPRETIEAAWGVVALALARTSKLNRGSAVTNPEVGKLVGLLRSLRDRAARLDQPPPSPEDARRFVDLARRAAARIEALD
jgi:hypothetical protein